MLIRSYLLVKDRESNGNETDASEKLPETDTEVSFRRCHRKILLC